MLCHTQCGRTNKGPRNDDLILTSHNASRVGDMERPVKVGWTLSQSADDCRNTPVVLTASTNSSCTADQARKGGAKPRPHISVPKLAQTPSPASSCPCLASKPWQDQLPCSAGFSAAPLAEQPLCHPAQPTHPPPLPQHHHRHRHLRPSWTCKLAHQHHSMCAATLRPGSSAVQRQQMHVVCALLLDHAAGWFAGATSTGLLSQLATRASTHHPVI